MSLAFKTSLILIFASAAIAAVADEALLIGTATHSDRTALPPGAVLQVKLEDVSLADAPAVVIASHTEENPGAPPYVFTLAYDPAQINARHTYAVRARVTLGARLLMTTDIHAPVITRDAPMQVDLILRPLASRADRAGRVRTAPGLTLPATFTGTTPMASGPSVRWHLDLWPDQTYHLRQTYGESDSAYDRGRWRADPARGAIVLRGGREAPIFLEILGGGDLRLMTREGDPIESDLAYNLAAGPLEPVEDVQFLTGMFRYQADAAVFAECLTGRTYPVAMEGAYIEAERAYVRLKDWEPGTPVLAVLYGRLAMRSAMEGADRTHLVIDSFLRLERQFTCATTGGHVDLQATAELTNTYWKIVEISGSRVLPVKNRREPHMILRTSEPGTFNATVGCNMIRGGYEIEGDRLSFGKAAMTRMTCPPALDSIERALTLALAQTVGWRLHGDLLELSDEGGEQLLKAKAVYFQ